MIRPVILAAALTLAAPHVQAFDRMLPGDCTSSIERLFDMIAAFDDEAPTAAAMVMDNMKATPDGWCRITSGAGMDDVAFDTLDWRADDVSRWTRDGIPPLALQWRITGLHPDEIDESDIVTDRPPLDLEATIRQDPNAGLIIIERVEASNEAGDLLALSGVFERVFLSSPSMMQVSLGSATFKAGLMELTLDGTHENPFAGSFSMNVNGSPEALGGGAFDLLSNLPDGVMDDASRTEMMAFSAELPKPVGTLEVSVASERGLGLMQVGMSMYSAFVAVIEDGTPSREMDILFDGLTIAADWTPAAAGAD